MIYLLYGEMGCGKNYVGEKFAEYIGCEFFDGDSVIPDDMVIKIEKFKLLKPSELIVYVSRDLLPAIMKKSYYGFRDLVVSQALYKKEYRSIITRSLPHIVSPIWIYTPWFQQLSQLMSREHGFKWVMYSLICKPFFQRPTEDYEIRNFKHCDLEEQFKYIIGR